MDTIANLQMEIKAIERLKTLDKTKFISHEEMLEKFKDE